MSKLLSIAPNDVMNYDTMAGFGMNLGALNSPSYNPFPEIPSADAVLASSNGTGSGLLGGMFGDMSGLDIGKLGLGAAQSLMSGFMGMKQYGLAEDALKESKRQFDLNFGAQSKLTNSRLEDRQRARVASNPGAYQSVGKYMQKNGI